MSRRIGWVLAVIVVLTGGLWLYLHTGPRNVSGTGEVFSHDPVSDATERLDIDGNPVKNEGAAPPTSMPSPPAAITPITAPTPQTYLASPAPIAPQNAVGVLPANDSIERNPPNGMAFGGAGKYQWYRQGNITWRIDTHSGDTCIDFATMDEWSKAIVYTNGCRNRG